MSRFWPVCILVVSLGMSAVAFAQQTQQNIPINIPPEVRERMQAEIEAYRAMPDMPGTGAYPATKEEDAGLPDHVVYRPADLKKVGVGSLPIVAWGNGGCSGDGASVRLHLLEIASHGYLVIANGTIQSGPGIASLPTGERRPSGEQMMLQPPASSAAQLTEAIDWAIAESSRPGSPYFGKLDTDAIAVSGWSCGGIQALTIATTDSRVNTVVIHNSGILPGGNKVRLPGMELGKEALAKLHAPIIYVLGGPTDIAYTNGMDDFERITGVPVLVANLDVGHGGTFYQANGGKAARVAAAWLDWQLKGDDSAAKWFIGPDCKLCGDPEWEVKRKNISAN